MSHLLVLKSAQRTSGTSSGFDIQLTRSFNFRSVTLEYASIPNTIYTITRGKNAIYFQHSTYANPLKSGIPPGFYTSATFPTAVQNAINSNPFVIPNTVTVTLDPLTARLVCTCLPGQTISFFNGGADTCLATGFTTQGPANIVTATNIMDLSGTSEVLLDISSIQKTTSSATALNIGNFVIPFDVITGSYTSFNINNNFEMTSESANLQNVHVNVRDADGNIVDLNGANWTIILRLKS